MDVPEDLRYSREHEWARIDGTRARVGITDFAQDSLGDIVFIDLPAVGSEVAAGASMGEVESTKSVSEIYAPVGGTVVAVNGDLADAPERLNHDPYGDGWICEIELSSVDAATSLLDATVYRALDRVLAVTGSEGPVGGGARRRRDRRPGSGRAATVGDVFCHNCGHRNPAGVNFCSSCGTALVPDASDTTVTLHAVDDHGETPDESSSVTLVEVPHGTGVLVIKRGPNVGMRYLLRVGVTRAGRHPESDIFLDDVTVSRRHAEIEQRPDGKAVIRDVGSLNGTYVNRERTEEAVLEGGDEVQIGKFKLVYLVAGDE